MRAVAVRICIAHCAGLCAGHRLHSRAHLHFAHFSVRAVAVRAVRHAHIHRAKHRRRIQLRKRRRGQGDIRSQHAPRVSGAIQRLREDGVGAVVAGLDNHIVGFRHAEPQFLNLHRLHKLAVGGNHLQRKAGNAQIEEGHGRGVDEAQPHPLAPREKSRPALRRRAPFIKKV